MKVFYRFKCCSIVEVKFVSHVQYSSLLLCLTTPYLSVRCFYRYFNVLRVTQVFSVQ